MLGCSWSIRDRIRGDNGLTSDPFELANTGVLRMSTPRCAFRNVLALGRGLAAVGSTMRRNQRLCPTAGVLAAGGDDVSADIAALFGARTGLSGH